MKYFRARFFLQANQTKIIMTDVIHGSMSEMKHSICEMSKLCELQIATNLVLNVKQT